MGGSDLNLPCFPLGKSPSAGLSKKFGKLLCGDGKHILRRLTVQHQLPGTDAKDIAEQVFVLWEHLIQQGDDSPLAVAADIYNGQAISGKLAQGDDVLFGQGSGGLLTKAHDLRDEQGVNGIGLGLADRHSAKSIGLNRVDDLDSEALFDRKGVDSKPVVARRLQTDDELTRGDMEALQQPAKLLTPCLDVGKRQTLDQ